MSKRMIAKGRLSDDESGVYLMQVVYDQNGDPRTEPLLDDPVPVGELDARIAALLSDGQFSGVWDGPPPTTFMGNRGHQKRKPSG
jgi:hypothetical protein